MNKFMLSAIFWLLVATYRQDTNIEGFAYLLAIVNYTIYAIAQFIEWRNNDSSKV